MRSWKQILIITKTTFKNWIRYPEDILGMLIYLGIIVIVGYAFSISGVMDTAVIPYYTVGLLVYSLLGQQNGIYINFGVWKEDILSKPVKPDVFLAGTFLGGLLTTSLPSIVLFFLVFIKYNEMFTLKNPVILSVLILLGILSAIGIGYIFASLGLRFRPQGYIVTTTSFLFSLLSGVLIPLSVLPENVRMLSYLIPYTWTIDLFRYYLLGTKPLANPNDEFLYLLISVVITIFVGKLYLEHTIRSIRRKKVIIR